MAQGSVEEYSVAPDRRSMPCARAASRMAAISACTVGSLPVNTLLPA